MRSMFVWVVLVLELVRAYSVAGNNNLEDLVYLTEQLPPHNFIQDGEIKGISVEILEIIWQRLGAKLNRSDIQLVPWARGYYYILNRDNTVLFGMGYTEERAQLLQWVGPYYSHAVSIIGRRDSPFRFDSLAGYKRLKVGVVREDIGSQVLQKNGFDPATLDQANGMQAMLKMLNAGRIDVVCYMDDIFFDNIQKLGFNPDDFAVFYPIKVFKSGYGFSKGIPAELVARFQAELNRLIADGTVARIMEKYKK